MTKDWGNVASPPRLHICFGDVERHLPELRKLARASRAVRWTINRSAIPGDGMVFYIMRPLSAFVALGVVSSPPYVIDDPKSEWHGMYAVDLRQARMLPRPVTLRDARQRFPRWGYLRCPRRSVLVPADVAGEFLEFLLGETAVV